MKELKIGNLRQLLYTGLEMPLVSQTQSKEANLEESVFSLSALHKNFSNY